MYTKMYSEVNELISSSLLLVAGKMIFSTTKETMMARTNDEKIVYSMYKRKNDTMIKVAR
jgi:hypothetical protein